MQTTITQTALDAIAPSLDPAAREMAHAACPDDAAAFAVEYVRAVAEVCGATASAQCAEGEEWEPEGILPADWDAIREAAEVVGVTIDGVLATAIGRLYRHPSTSAYDAAGLARRPAPAREQALAELIARARAAIAPAAAAEARIQAVVSEPYEVTEAMRADARLLLDTGATLTAIAEQVWALLDGQWIAGMSDTTLAEWEQRVGTVRAEALDAATRYSHRSYVEMASHDADEDDAAD